MRIDDQNNIKNVDKIIAIAKNVQHRIKHSYNRDSILIYPGGKLSKLKYKKTGDFYLSTARLSPDKRVDVIVKAFKKMPDKKLIVISAGPSYDGIKKLAKGSKNIQVLGYAEI